MGRAGGKSTGRTPDWLGPSDDGDGDAGSGAPAAGTGFDFGDAARMGAEFATRLGGAPAGQRGW